MNNVTHITKIDPKIRAAAEALVGVRAPGSQEPEAEEAMESFVICLEDMDLLEYRGILIRLTEIMAANSQEWSDARGEEIDSIMDSITAGDEVAVYDIASLALRIERLYQSGGE